MFLGEWAAYAGADTWYPSWAADGNLYTPWTDGSVVDSTTNITFDSGSGCMDDDCVTTTGFAKIIGDDPMDLTITGVGTFESKPLPYHGRYPCGSLYYENNWFYGTYTLDNENGEPGRRTEENSRRLEAGYCENWCISGPFVGFRTSSDQGNTWDEAR